MKSSLLTPIFLLLFLFTAQTSFAQAWKNSEKRQAINREATIKKRIINNENAINRNRDEALETLYKTRLSLLKSAAEDITKWNASIESNQQNNSYRYNLLTNTKLSKADAIQTLVNVRLAEIAYKVFGRDFKEEALPILTELRQKEKDSLKNFDVAIDKIMANIE